MKSQNANETATNNNSKINYSQELFDQMYTALAWSVEMLRATEYALFEKGFKPDEIHTVVERIDSLLAKVEGKQENANV